jgi:hypothetical protein
MSLTVPELGVLFLLIFGVTLWLGVFPTTRAILGFLGVVAVGTSGFAGQIMADIGAWAQSAFGSLTGWIFGVPLAVGLFIILAFIFIHDLSPKKTAGKRTGWVGIALGVLVVIGVAGFPLLAGLAGVIDSLLSNIVTAINSI